MDRKEQMDLMKGEELESPIKWQVPSFEAQDPLIEVNLGTDHDPKMIKANGLLAKGNRNWLIGLIKQYKDCFA